MRLIIARIGMFLYENTPLKETGKILFLYGEREYAKRDYEDLQNTFRIIKEDLAVRDDKSLTRAVVYRRTIEKSLSKKEEAIEYAEMADDPEFDLLARCPLYADIIGLEKEMIRWLKRKEKELRKPK